MFAGGVTTGGTMSCTVMVCKAVPTLPQASTDDQVRLTLQARRTGGYQFMREYSGHVSFPGLFQGTSGVSYALLRLALPSWWVLSGARAPKNENLLFRNTPVSIKVAD